MREVLTVSEYDFHELVTLPEELVTPDVVREKLRQDAELFLMLPERLQTLDMLLCSVCAPNFRLHMCPSHLLDAAVCECYVSEHRNVDGVPDELLTADMCERVADTYGGALSIPSHMITDSIVDNALLAAIDRNYAYLIMCSGTDMAVRMWWRCVTNDDQISRNLLSYFFSEGFCELFYAGDIRAASSYVSNINGGTRNRWIMLLLAAGEREELTQRVSDYLNTILEEVKTLLENLGSIYLGTKMKQSLSNALECAHAL